MMRITASGRSDVGLTRQHNEDSYEIDPERQLYLVADGMGGHTHGEVASRTAVDAICQYVVDYAKDGTPPPLPEQDAELSKHLRLLKGAILSAHERVLREIRQDGSLHGMGTTVAAFLVAGESAVVAHVGDSRIYRLRSGDLRLLTEDHTWVNEQVTAGFLSEDQARVHPLKNVVTRALGGEGDLEVDVDEVDLQPGDRYLLCSDGLTTMLRDAEIADRMRRRESPEQVCGRLVAAAQERGGYDDTTVIVLDVTG